LDLVGVFKGLLSPSRDKLLLDKRAQDYIVSVLKDPGGKGDGKAAVLKRGETGRITVSSWQPAHVQMIWGEDDSGRAVTLTLPEPPAFWQYQVWTETDGPCAEGVATISAGGIHSYTPVREGELLGLRLIRTGELNPVAAGTVGSAYAARTAVDATVSLRALASGILASEGAKSGAGVPPAPGQGGAEQRDLSGDGDLAYPLVRVVNRSKRTTHKEPKERCHAYWTLDFGDGIAQRIDCNPVLAVSHEFPRPGTYTVRAQSFDGGGVLLLEREWQIRVADSTERLRAISCASVVPPQAHLSLTGPIMWVTGKPAVFTAGLQLDLPAHVEILSEKFDPAPKFAVIWERSGDFTVSCAATVKLRYSLGDEVLTLENTYVHEVPVTVLTTGVTR